MFAVDDFLQIFPSFFEPRGEYDADPIGATAYLLSFSKRHDSVTLMHSSDLGVSVDIDGREVLLVAPVMFRLCFRSLLAQIGFVLGVSPYGGSQILPATCSSERPILVAFENSRRLYVASTH